MGSGVSILRVTSMDSFERVGGTACGGATFLGLIRLMTSARTFEEALELAKRGNADCVDKLVEDIYGSDGCKHLGLPGSMTAAHFGKLAKGTGCTAAEEADVAAALLQMVTQASTVLTRAFVQNSDQQQYGPVFFVG